MAERLKQKTVSPLFAFCVLSVIFAIGLLMILSVHRDSAAMQQEYASLQQRSAEQTLEARQLSAEVSILQTTEYIMTKAREMYGYSVPGEIRFIIANP